MHQMQNDGECRESLTSFISCSVLKTFPQEKRLEGALVVYKELSIGEVNVSIVTFDALIDACWGA